MRRKLLHKHVPPYFHFWNVRGCTLPKSAGAGLISNHANRPEKRQWGHGGRVGTGWALMAFSRAFAPPHPNHAVQHQPGPRHPHVGSKAWCHHGDIQNRLWASSLLYISEQRISSSFLLSLLWTEDRPNLVALASFCSKVLKGVFVAAPWLSWRWVISWGGGVHSGGTSRVQSPNPMHWLNWLQAVHWVWRRNKRKSYIYNSLMRGTLSPSRKLPSHLLWNAVLPDLFLLHWRKRRELQLRGGGGEEIQFSVFLPAYIYIPIVTSRSRIIKPISIFISNRMCCWEQPTFLFRKCLAGYK